MPIATKKPVAKRGPRPSQMDLLSEVLSDYEIEGELGSGAAGSVLQGRHRLLEREVAIKLLRGDLLDEEMRGRFVVEARLLASFDHPHIVPIYDYKEQDGLAVLVMEKLAGGTVWQRFQVHGYTPQAACALIVATCSALQYAHERGVLHRDIKPENLIYNSQGVVKVTDFGIAKVMDTTRARATRTGHYFGTPAYMAPEQAQGVPPAPTVDIYSTGVLLYELLSGQVPFGGETDPLQLIVKRFQEDAPNIRKIAPSVPDRVAKAVMKAIAPRPEDRWQSAAEFGAAIATAAEDAWGVAWIRQSGAKVSGGSTAVLTRPATAPVAAPVKRRRGVKLVALALAFANLGAGAYASTVRRLEPAPAQIQTNRVAPQPGVGSSPIDAPSPTPTAEPSPVQSDAPPASQPAQVQQGGGSRAPQGGSSPSPASPKPPKPENPRGGGDSGGGEKPKGKSDR